MLIALSILATVLIGSLIYPFFDDDDGNGSAGTGAADYGAPGDRSDPLRDPASPHHLVVFSGGKVEVAG